MSLGITQLKAPPSRKWSWSERVQESFLRNPLMSCSLYRAGCKSRPLIKERPLSQGPYQRINLQSQ